LSTPLQSRDVILEPADNRRLAELCGQFDENLRHLEARLGVEINNRGNRFRVIGDQEPVALAEEVLKNLYQETAAAELTPNKVHLVLQKLGAQDIQQKPDLDAELVTMHTRHGDLKPMGANQARYIQSIMSHDLTFGVGPAGTGKTYLAVGAAVSALEQERVRRLLLVRPAVEAGERLGFLPGDLVQKIDPYLRPLYDALYEMLGFERVTRLVEQHIIEVAPLAYMRGRTLNESFIILDEAQNSTVEQMKMFLTRIGFGSKIVVTGDVTQIDLPNNRRSGLRHAIEVLRDVRGISFTFFQARDVVRHTLVQNIVKAYESYESKVDRDGD